ncbi:DNA-binding transcriptional regulator, ArsR family [Amycolatopsis arida]|uniref:DNA-binding transcriptional regulator, ArsR family n=1 Tax=Amycolatopsis arida TaxID=587909 RepID=A0A1I5QCH5_9PSEU|nr:winged helix-turn-helix domain-containing protein [Amycolatopsis arida]TDX98792.1 DNA-binding transcriptional ArsR family regulator [Amycolatopsis arida]SFP44009.1 DNA-binding transcriptional regulator, ArsR family [Amycolatopsis arida]
MSATELAALAGLLADRTRAEFCLALLDGRAWTVGELAARAGVAPATASEHLDRLVAGGLLVQRRQGRHRYVCLAGPEAAELVETLAGQAGTGTARPRGLRAARASAALAGARTCYDHLAGRLGVAVTGAMVRRGLLDLTGGCALTGVGLEWLTGPVGVAPELLRATRRPMARVCLDWTERRPHLAGVAGARLCSRAFERGWVRRIGSGRAVRVTPEGAAALVDLLGLDATEWAEVR